MVPLYGRVLSKLKPGQLIWCVVITNFNSYTQKSIYHLKYTSKSKMNGKWTYFFFEYENSRTFDTQKLTRYPDIYMAKVTKKEEATFIADILTF